MADLDMLHTFRNLVGEDENEGVLVFILNSVEESVLNYCHRKELPNGLKNTVLRMAVDMYKEEAYGKADDTGRVKSVSVGDTSTSFSTEQTSYYVDSLLKNYEKTLRNYRKLVTR